MVSSNQAKLLEGLSKTNGSLGKKDLNSKNSAELDTLKNLKMTQQKTSGHSILSTAKTSFMGESEAFNKSKQSGNNTAEATKESKLSNLEQVSTKSSDMPQRNYDCPVPTVTIKKCGFTSHVLPSQMDICIVNDTCEIDREYYEEAKPEHVHWI